MARYGDFILFEPPFKATTYVLWVGPFVLLVVALVGVTIFFRRRAAQPVAVNELSDAERNRIVEILAENEREGGA